MNPTLWNSLSPRGRQWFLNVKTNSLIFYPSWDELTGEQQAMINNWYRLKLSRDKEWR